MIFSKNKIMIHKIGAETCPESIDPLASECMPEVGIKLLSSLEKIEYIEEPIVLIDTHTRRRYHLDKSRLSK
jgi:hypothetical protein